MLLILKNNQSECRVFNTLSLSLNTPSVLTRYFWRVTSREPTNQDAEFSAAVKRSHPIGWGNEAFWLVGNRPITTWSSSQLSNGAFRLVGIRRIRARRARIVLMSGTHQSGRGVVGTCSERSVPLWLLWNRSRPIRTLCSTDQSEGSRPIRAQSILTGREPTIQSERGEFWLVRNRPPNQDAERSDWSGAEHQIRTQCALIGPKHVVSAIRTWSS